MPPPARRDRILFGILIFAVGSTLGGVVGFVLSEPSSVAYLTFGVLASIHARSRWHAALVAEVPLPEA